MHAQTARALFAHVYNFIYARNQNQKRKRMHEIFLMPQQKKHYKLRAIQQYTEIEWEKVKLNK